MSVRGSSPAERAVLVLCVFALLAAAALTGLWSKHDKDNKNEQKLTIEHVYRDEPERPREPDQIESAPARFQKL